MFGFVMVHAVGKAARGEREAGHGLAGFSIHGTGRAGTSGKPYGCAILKLFTLKTVEERRGFGRNIFPIKKHLGKPRSF